MQRKGLLNIDDFVDYRSEYSEYVKKAVVLGEKMTGLCPFHSDNNRSFSVDLKTGKWHCFTEDIGGNYIDFLAKINGTDTKEAYQSILKKYGKDERKEEKPKDRNYSLEQYAADKHLPAEWLAAICGLETGTSGKTKTSFLKIWYFDKDGNKVVYRQRFANKQFYWQKGSSGKIGLYGEWMLPSFDDYAILVEGESDTQSLWYMGLNALGVPGASMFKPAHVPQLEGLTLYLHRELDRGGDTFIEKTLQGLRTAGFDGEIKKFTCGTQPGCKDPSDILIKHGNIEGAKIIKRLMQDAKKVNLNEVPEVIKGAPVNLRTPTGWRYDETGIYKIAKDGDVSFVCGTPIIITKRVKDLESDDEKIEIALYRTEGSGRKRWKSLLTDRDVIFTTKATTRLANAGAIVTSENIKPVIRFLSALEVANDDVIEFGESTSVMGWHSKGRFLPGVDDGIIKDFKDQAGAIAASYHSKGSLDEWVKMMQVHRDRNRFRFIVAAALAPPLLKLLHQRTFFVYYWGDARSGKTAGLKAALSAWGNPEGLMMNFNTTQVGLERQAALFTDLPLGIDERQAAGSGQYGQNKIENLVYMIGEGKGRTRGGKDGGIQKTHEWRTIAIATGEEPLTSETSQTGIATRVLELRQGPFRNEIEAGQMHQDSAENYGYAGPEFIKHLVQYSTKDLKKLYNEMVDYLRSAGSGKVGSHVSSIAMVALADALANDWIFEPVDDTGQAELGKQGLGISPHSWNKAREMALEVLHEQLSAASSDVNANATRMLIDWVYMNQQGFTQYAPKRLGIMSDDGETVYIAAQALTQALKEAGYNPKKTRAYLAEKGYISKHKDKNGKDEYTVIKRTPPDKDGATKVNRFVEFFLGKAMGLKDEDKDIPDDDFVPIDVDEDELPFD